MVVILSFTILIFAVVYDGNRTLNTAVLQNVQSSITQTSQLLNLTVSTYVSAGDLTTVSIFFKELLEEDDANGLSYVVICNDQGVPVVNTMQGMKRIPEPNALDQLEKAIATGVIHVRNPILLPNQNVGFLQYGLSIKNLVDATVKEKRNSLIRILLIFVFTLVVFFIFGQRLSKRIIEMTTASKEIVSGKYQQVIDVKGRDELTVLAEHFNLMAFEVSKKIQEITDLNQSLELRVEDRTKDLAQANQRLEENFANLKTTQNKLIQSEKMASLGSLVAGVAHELNTPIGNALTVVSTLTDKQNDIRSCFQDGQLKKSRLDRYVRMIEDASVLLESNIVRASTLIQSFKTIAVNQTTENRSRFKLAELLRTLQPTLRLQGKHKLIDFRFDQVADLAFDSYSGAITQIIVNLYANAALHAFEGREGGRIEIEAGLDPDQEGNALIQFSDDGVGIAPENLRRIFDPFFTTRLGQGGSGLGLNICYNIANNILGGSLKATSIEGQGTSFWLSIALNAPIPRIERESTSLEGA